MPVCGDRHELDTPSGPDWRVKPILHCVWPHLANRGVCLSNPGVCGGCSRGVVRWMAIINLWHQPDGCTNVWYDQFPRSIHGLSRSFLTLAHLLWWWLTSSFVNWRMRSSPMSTRVCTCTPTQERSGELCGTHTQPGVQSRLWCRLPLYFVFHLSFRHAKNC